MDADDAIALVTTLRRIGGEPERVEVKNGSGGFPRSVRETLVAFANSDGGTIVIGVDEANDFEVVGVPEAAKYRDSVAQLARDDVTPALQVETEIVVVGDRRVLVISVPPAPPSQKPVYVTTQGITNGAYVRSGDGDRRMSEGEIGVTYAVREQMRFDTEPVEGCTVADLDHTAVLRTLQKARSGAASLTAVDDLTALCRMGILTAATAEAPPTLAGLLALGTFPQQQFPQLMVSVVVHPPDSDRSVRFLDNVTVRGNIPEIVAQTMGVLRRNLAARAVMSGLGREDQLEYPLDAIREAIVNAIMHRDYHPILRGTQVQVDLYADRLVIRSPGGLFGGITVEDLGTEGITSSRNAVLAGILSDTLLPNTDMAVAENRAAGIPSMIQLARSNGLPRPVFRSTITSFTVTMGRSQLLGPETRRWMSGLGLALPTSMHEIALAMLRAGRVSNAMLREWGADRIEAGQVLRDLVDQGAAIKEGGRRYAQYVIDLALVRKVPKGASVPGPASLPGGPVAASLRELGVAVAADLQRSTGLARNTVVTQLRALVASGDVEADGAPNSPKRSYRWIGRDTS